MEWISFFDRKPEHGQDIWYYGEMLGVWCGVYYFAPDDNVSPHVIHCSESPGNCDRMDAPWWIPDDRIMSRPQKPTTPYPPDYPH